MLCLLHMNGAQGHKNALIGYQQYKYHLWELCCQKTDKNTNQVTAPPDKTRPRNGLKLMWCISEDELCVKRSRQGRKFFVVVRIPRNIPRGVFGGCGGFKLTCLSIFRHPLSISCSINRNQGHSVESVGLQASQGGGGCARWHSFLSLVRKYTN